MSSKSVFQKMGKTLVWMLTSLLLIIALLLVLLRFTPQVYVTLVNKFTQYNIESTQLGAKLLPASLTFTDLKVTQSLANQSTIEVVSAESFNAQIDWIGFLSSNHNFWYAEISDAQVQVGSILANSQPQESDSSAAPTQALNIHNVLSLLNMSISNTDIVFSENTKLTISELNTDIGKKAKQNAAEVTQNIQLSIKFKETEKTLSAAGSLHSEYKNGVSNITLKLGTLDLTSLIQSNEVTEATPTAIANGEAARASKTNVDWGWMNRIETSSFGVSVEAIVAGESRADTIEIKSLIGESIEIESAKANLKWSLASSLWLKDALELTGKLTPLKNGLLETSLFAKASDSAWKLEGSLDITQPLNSDASLKINATNLPLVNDQMQTSELLSGHKQWLPFTTDVAVTPFPRNSTTIGVDIALEKLIAGESDLSGNLRVSGLSSKIEEAYPVSVKGTLTSDRISYISEKDDSKNKAKDTESTPDTRVFSKEPIDWSWLSAVQIDTQLKINKLRINDRALDNVELPVFLASKGLKIERASAELGDGAILGSLSVSPSGSEQVAIDLTARASGIVLNDLNLVDEKTLKGGDSRLELALSSSGGSAYELASKLDGQGLFHIKKATIGNDAFELLGSDLFTELISKLNPFLKSDPTTDLKCAVVNLDIKQGQVEVDKSIAMETSKMIIVADGTINLEKETINLEIEPQSTGGIGLDAGSLVKFLELGGTLSNPKPKVGADGLLKSGVAVGAALSTGGASLVLDGLVSKMTSGKACKRALEASDTKE